MSTYSTLSGRLVGTIKDNIKNMLKEFEVTEKIYREHVCNLPVEVQEDLTNLEVWTSNNLTFIENLNKGILSKTSKSNLTDKETLEEIVDILYEFSGAKSVLLGLAAMHESIEELRADMKGESK